MTPASVAFDPARFARLARVQAVAPSPDGQWLAVQVDRLDRDGARYVGDLWRLALHGDQPPHRLTSAEHADRAPAFRSDGALLFVSDRPRPGETDARPQVWCLPAQGGEPTPVTDEPLGVEAFQVAGAALVVQTSVWPGVAHDRQRAHDDERKKKGPSALHYTRMPVRHWDHWLPTPAPHLVAYTAVGRRDLTPDADREHRQAQWHLADDGRTLVVTCRRPGRAQIDDVDLRLISLEDGHFRDFTAEPGHSLEEPRLSHNGEHLACVHAALTRPPTYRPRLALITVATGERVSLADEVELFFHPVGFTPDGALVATADDRGRVPVYRIERSGQVIRLTAPTAGGAHTGVVLAGTQMVGIRSTFRQPPAPFVAPLEVHATPRLLATTFGEAVPEVQVNIEEFSVVAPGGAPVQSFLLTPTTTGPHPLLLWIHGGPIGTHADAWHWRWNPLLAVAAGYAVALPNPRGSTGFGQAFVDGVWDNRTGAECFHDLMAVTDALHSRQDLDPRRFVAMGGSFGGYMANLIGTRTDRFAALVSHAGIYSYPQFRSTTDEPGWFAYGFGFEPDDHDEAFRRHCPQHAVRGYRTPTLILHGDRDYRVPVGEALALFEALQRHQVPSELVIFPDENHWILKPRNVVAWYEAWIDFLGRVLPA